MLMRKNEGFSMEEVVHHLPNVIEMEPDQFRSKIYSHIPTIDILNELKDDFVITSISRQRTRRKEMQTYSKHQVTLRSKGINPSSLDEFPEISIFNSHNGTSSLKLSFGMFRLVCSNGMTVPTKSFHSRKFIHKNLNLSEVISHVREMKENSIHISQRILMMKERILNEDEKMEVAKGFFKIRYEKFSTEENLKRVLKPLRKEDEQDDLWTTFNVVQEKMIRGSKFENGRDNGFRLILPKKDQLVQRPVRFISSMDGRRWLNETLWQHVEETFEDLK